jgi:hypothetical protein
MSLSTSQKGAIGQFTFLANVLTTGNGEVEVYAPVADNEGRDAQVRRHLKSTPGISIQVKVTVSASRQRGTGSEYLNIHFSTLKDRVQKDPRLWYFFATYDRKQLRFHDPVFLVPAPVFHRIGRQGKPTMGRVWFAMKANLGPKSRDRWTPYRLAQKDLGKRLLAILDEATLTGVAKVVTLSPDAMWLSRARRPALKARPVLAA